MADKTKTLKLPPQSLEAEQAVLGCMLIDPEAVPKAMQILTKKSFINSSHVHVFTAILNLFEKNATVDNITVTDELKNNFLIEHNFLVTASLEIIWDRGDTTSCHLDPK